MINFIFLCVKIFIKNKQAKIKKMYKVHRLTEEEREMIRTYHAANVRKGYRSALIVKKLSKKYHVSIQSIYYAIRHK